MQIVLKLYSSGFMRLVLGTNCAVRHLLYPQCHMSSKKHSNAAGQSSRGSASKGGMQLTSYLWKKIGMLWKNYGKAMEFLFWASVRTLLRETSNYATTRLKRFLVRENDWKRPVIGVRCAWFHSAWSHAFNFFIHVSTIRTGHRHYINIWC